MSTWCYNLLLAYIYMEKFCWKLCRLWSCPFIRTRGLEFTIPIQSPTFNVLATLTLQNVLYWQLTIFSHSWEYLYIPARSLKIYICYHMTSSFNGYEVKCHSSIPFHHSVPPFHSTDSWQRDWRSKLKDHEPPTCVSHVLPNDFEAQLQICQWVDVSVELRKYACNGYSWECIEVLAG